MPIQRLKSVKGVPIVSRMYTKGGTFSVLNCIERGKGLESFRIKLCWLPLPPVRAMKTGKKMVNGGAIYVGSFLTVHNLFVFVFSNVSVGQ